MAVATVSTERHTCPICEGDKGTRINPDISISISISIYLSISISICIYTYIYIYIYTHPQLTHTPVITNIRKSRIVPVCMVRKRLCLSFVRINRGEDTLFNLRKRPFFDQVRLRWPSCNEPTAARIEGRLAVRRHRAGMIYIYIYIYI